MSRHDLTFDITAHYGQVSVEAEGAELPEWVTGEEPVVCTENAVWVATRSDADGPVTIVIRFALDPSPPGQVVYDGALVASTPRLRIGNELAGDVHSIDLAWPGPYRVRVSIGPPPVAFVFVEIEPEARAAGS